MLSILGIVIVIMATAYYKRELLAKYFPLSKRPEATVETTIAPEATLRDKEAIIGEAEDKETLPLQDPVVENDAQQEQQLPTEKDQEEKFQLSAKVTIYRHYLSLVNTMSINFLRDKSFQYQITQIRSLKFPPDIEDILSSFEEYDSQYLQQLLLKEKIFPTNSSLFERFIKIEKNSDILKEKKAIKQRLTEDLDFLVEFFYSEELQKIFLE